MVQKGDLVKYINSDGSTRIGIIVDIKKNYVVVRRHATSYNKNHDLKFLHNISGYEIL